MFVPTSSSGTGLFDGPNIYTESIFQREMEAAFQRYVKQLPKRRMRGRLHPCRVWLPKLGSKAAQTVAVRDVEASRVDDVIIID
eukprot:9412422-Pyramimonas_sp.AAC.1